MKILRYWIPLAVAITCPCGLVYLTVQQNYRQTANDPQIQLSEDVADQLSKGAKPESLITTNGKIDISKSLTPFAIVYDDLGNELYSNASLDGQTPKLPDGVLNYTKEHKQNRITWQPKPGVRIATVITYFNGTNSGSVLVGRSMREVEIREDRLMTHVGAGWLITIVATFILSLILTSGRLKK